MRNSGNTEVDSFVMQVLAVLWGQEPIERQKDRESLEDLLGNDITYLYISNHQQLSEFLASRKWDIFFFSGRSSTDDLTDKFNLIELENISAPELKSALRSAVKNGLKLAIFNSEDSFDSAQALSRLRIPHAIVMREPAPDEIAQKFLLYFLESFSQGVSLDKAVKSARGQLRNIEPDFPCASFLPVIYEFI